MVGSVGADSVSVLRHIRSTRKGTVMADNKNTGQFGNRSDTEEQARKGGEQSPGQFGASEGADPSKAGEKGGEESPGRFDRSEGADPSEAGEKGGEQSPGQFGASEGADPSKAGEKGAEAQSKEDKAKGGRNS